MESEIGVAYLVLAGLVALNYAGEDKNAPCLVLREHGGVLQDAKEVAVRLVSHQVLNAMIINSL